MAHFQAIATGWEPRAESSRLLELLESESEEPAAANDRKHRLHALRCEYADARQRATEAEEQLAEARLRILRLEARVTHLETTLQQIHASRWWKVKEWFARPWRIVSRWFGREQPALSPAEGCR